MSSTAHHARPLLGLRKRPGRIALAAMRLPRPLYHHGLGKLLGHTFLLITHQGRMTGTPHETVAMALTWNHETNEVIVCSVWGETQWVRNLRAHPALAIQIGAERFAPQQCFLSHDEAAAVAVAFRKRHPGRMRLFSSVLGWGDLDSDSAVREFVSTRPFIAFRATEAEAGSTTAS